MGKRYPKNRPKAVDLFCGAGGMSLGFEQAGFEILLGVDSDGHHIAAHKRNFPYGQAVCTSVATLSAADIRDITAWNGDVDLLFGGPPCQGFSNMGLRDKYDPRNTLVNEFVRIALELLPRFVVLENVPGMLSGITKAVLDAAIADLSKEYNVVHPVRVLNAADFGVPQDRRRVFLLASRKDIVGSLRYPNGASIGQPPRPNVATAIYDLPDVDKHEHLFNADEVDYDRDAKSLYAKVARGFAIDPSDLSLPRKWDQSRCSGCMRTRHTTSTVELYQSTLPGMTVPGHKLPRLDPDGLCPTLRAGSDSSRGSYTSPRPVHPRLPRCITVREAARLHGYPDWFRFVPTKWHAYKQIGNSVCPPVARAVGHAILRILNPATTAATPKALPLGDNFVVPDNAPKQKPRIPQLREFPPVIHNLFMQGYDEKNKRLWRAKFSFADVQEAITATRANLRWVRSDTFLTEISRSRRVKELLREPLRRGYTILPIKYGEYIGEFVPAATPGTVEKKDDIGVKVGELSRAQLIQMSAASLNDFDAYVEEFFSLVKVKQVIWNGKAANVLLGRAMLLNGHTPMSDLRVKSVSGRSTSALFVLGTEGNVPSRSRIRRLALDSGRSEVVVATRVTSRHLLVSRYTQAKSAPRESARVVFALNGHDSGGEYLSRWQR